MKFKILQLSFVNLISDVFSKQGCDIVVANFEIP